MLFLLQLIASSLAIRTSSQLYGRLLCNLTNEFRLTQSLPAVALSYTMEYVAQAHIDNLIVAGHNIMNATCNLHSWYPQTLPTGITIPACCYPSNSCMSAKAGQLTANWVTPYFNNAAENSYANLAQGFGSFISPEQVIDSWQRSPKHRDLMLNPYAVVCGAIINTTYSNNYVQNIALMWMGNAPDPVPYDYQGDPLIVGTNPTSAPVKTPTSAPVKAPTSFPTRTPTWMPVTQAPTYMPTPELFPTPGPQTPQTPGPQTPTPNPSFGPTKNPTTSPTRIPTTRPSQVPTIQAPTIQVPTTTQVPTATQVPSATPTQTQSAMPTQVPTSTSSYSETAIILSQVLGLICAIFIIGTIVYYCRRHRVPQSDEIPLVPLDSERLMRGHLVDSIEVNRHTQQIERIRLELDETKQLVALLREEIILLKSGRFQNIEDEMIRWIQTRRNIAVDRQYAPYVAVPIVPTSPSSSSSSSGSSSPTSSSSSSSSSIVSPNASSEVHEVQASSEVHVSSEVSSEQ